MIFNAKDNDSKQRFGIRKLTIGACSVLLSTIILGVSTQGQTNRVQAATTDASPNSSIVNSTDNDQNKNTYSTSNEVNGIASEATSTHKKEDVGTVNATQNVSSENNDEKVKTSASATENNELNTGNYKNKSAVEEKNSASVDKLKTNDENKVTGDSNKENTVENTKNSEEQKDNTNVEKNNKNTHTATIEKTFDSHNITSDTANVDLSKTQDDSSANKLEDAASSSMLKNANASRARVLAASTTKENIAEADEIKENATVTIPSTDGRYTLYISRNTWGNTIDGDQPAKVLLSGNVLAGDTVTISIPSYGIVGVNQPTIDANYGSASIKDVGNNKVVTYNFTASGVINPIITIPPDNGYGGKPTPMQIAQPTVKDITWTVNGVEQTSAEFHIDVNPVWNPKFSLSKPDPNSTDKNALKKMIPDYESIYQLAINETNGVAPGQDYSNTPYPSQKINSAVNYGTVITIPMPKGYVLDQSATMQLNNFGDKTTITQEGNNVIITVPKGSGTQNWNSGPAYQLVGSYDIAMPAIATTYTADAQITIVQKLNDDGSQTKTWNGPTVSQDFYGINDEIPLGQMPLYAKAAYNGNQLLNNGHKQIVAYFGITNESIASYNDYSSKLTFNFDEGLGVTELKTPTIPGTSNYKYTITYADGTTNEGQISAGNTITGTGVITNIVVSPDDFERDQSTAVDLPTNKFANQTTQSVNAFEAYGAVPETVKSGTQLVANLTFTGTIQQGNITKYLTSKIQVDQTVVSSADLTSSSGIFGYQSNTATGQSNVGYLSVYAGGGQTNNIYEPIFYYVLPEWFSVYDFSTDYTKLPDFVPNTNNGVIGTPKLSVFTVPTEISGLSRQVVKIDYSGTGYNFLAGQGANNQIHLNTLPDGTNGTYQGIIYIVSPTTKLTNTAYNPNNTSNFAPSGITFNPDWVQENTSNLYYVGANGFTINQVGGANTASVAQGNQNDILVDSGVANLYDSNKMEYGIRLINVSGSNLTNVVALVNLPQASDTSFTFQLNGRPVYDGDKSGYTFLYSTELGDLKNNSDPDGTKPDETGYVTADQVTDWSKIKSIIIKVAALSNNERSDRLVFTGTDPNLVNDAGKTGYLNTGFYSDTTKPFVSSLAVYNASTAPNKVKPANITITGEANINFKLQYIDENGQLQTINLPDLSTSYNLAQNNTMLTEQEAIELANKNAASSIPANYEIKSATLQSGGKTWQTDAPEGTPVFGGQVQYFYNNATVLLQAVPIQRTLTYQVIDENDPSKPVTIQPNTDLLNNGQVITGNQGSNVPNDATTAYDAVKNALEAKGYVISSKSSTVPTIFGPDNTALTIYVTHKTINVSTPDQWPSTSTDADKVSLSKTITRTITVEGLPTAVEGTTQTVTFTRTAVVDEVTGKVIGYVDPSDTSQTITDGDNAWTSTNNKWDAFIPSNVSAGYSIQSITDANGNYPNVTSADGKLTGVAQTTVSVNENDVTVTITYQGNEVSNTITFIDTDDDNKQVGATITISGRVGETDNNLNLTIPEGYELASGASLPTSYTFKATNTPITIPLVHKHKTVGPNDTWPSMSTEADKVALSETITRTINVSGLPSSIPSVEQNVTFIRTAIVDEVTGKVIGYVDPSDSTKTITNGADAWTSLDPNWSNWTNSNVPEGYYIESAKVGNDNYTAVTTNSNGIITGLNSITVTPGMSSITVNVVYNKVSLDLTINHDLITNTYNGIEQPVSADVISAITHIATSSNSNVPVPNIAQAIQNANLTSDDYSYTDSQGNALTGVPTNAGNYRIILNQNGLDKLNKVASGLTINYDPSKSYVSYIIEKAEATAQLEGNNSKTYDGKAVTNVEVTKDGNIKVTANVPATTEGAYQLQAGDYDWYSADGSTKLTGAPTNVGNYTIKLNSTGIANIKAHYGNSDNINWTDDAITGSATYEITKAAATISLTPDKNKQTSSWTGSEISINPADFVPTITTDNGVTLTVPAGTLAVDDYTITPSPVAPGTYPVSLTDSGIEKIKKAISTSGNYTWNNTGNGALEIVNAKADYQMSGSGETTYTGSAVELPIDQLKAAISSSNTVSGQDLVIADLDASDFTWSSGTAPTNVGEYTIKLNEAGINKITDANPNYDLTLGTNAFTYTINAADATAKLSGNNEKTYNAQATTTAEVNSNGQIKVTLDYLGKTENYTLQLGDYTWSTSDGNAPTDVGTYTIKLTDAGLTNLQKVINDKNGAGNVILSTSANNAGTASFEITKATPSASFTGQGEKTYDGTPISGYAPIVTITAPGQNDVTLVAGTDYVWTKDDQTFTTVPSDAGNYTVSLTDAGIAKIKAVNAENLDWSNVTISQNASYTINKAQATVNFDQPASQTVEYGKSEFDVNNFKPSISTNNQVTVNIPAGVNLSAEAGDFEFTDASGNTTTTVPTELGSYTVTLSETGFKKLQSQTNNYDWVMLHAKGIYTVAKATNVSVALTGDQKVIYTGDSFTNSDINVANYQVTLGNGQTYKLVAGDLEFVPSQDPTNTGSYKVQLSAQGKENIAKVDSTHYSYDFDNAGIGSFEIQKATPSVKFNANAEKVFDGTPIALDDYKTQPSVTVTAPGNPTITLETGDYVWVKDSVTYTTAPSNVGSYTIQLTEAGKNNILQNSNNAENLDWANAKISGQGSYVITEATATANLSGDSSKTYDGNPVTTTEINSKDGTVEVTITIPNSTETVTYKLHDGDYTWNTPNGDAPSDAGSYTLSLSKTGLTNLQSAIDGKWGEGNVKITDSDLKGEATFTINKTDITISGDGSQTGTYTGNLQVVDPGNFPITLTPEGNGPVPTIPDGTLTSGDFVVKGKDGSPVDPTDVGNYTVYLTPEGVEKLKKLNPNYNWPITEQEVGTLVINAAQVSATVSGENSRGYNGQAISTANLYQGGDINVTISGINGDKITYTLKDGDYDWNVSDPTDVGTYTLTLNRTGISHLQEVLTAKYGAGNVTLANTAVTGDAKFTIIPADITISGNGSQTGTYTGNPQVVDPENFPITLKPEGNGPVPTIPDGTLTSGDFVVKGKDGSPVDPTDVGDYTVYLTPEGVEKLKKLNPNYNWPTTEQEVGTLIITPAKMDVTLSGNGSKISDGQPANVDLSTLVDNLTGANLNKDGLTLDDFSWNTSDGKAPSKVGNYTITLNANGLKKLQDNNPNYTVNVTGEFTYTITAASQKIEYVDGNGKVIKTIDNISTDSSNYGDKVDFDVEQNVPKDYKLVDSNVPTQITIENGVTRFVVEPDIVTTTDTKTVTRTIIVENPDGSENKVVQTVTFTRPKYTDPVNGEVTYGEWDKSSGNWNKYNAPEIPGYTSNEVPEEVVTPSTEDKTVTVKYTKNPLVETTDTKTVTRTIIVETPDGSEDKVVQTVTFTRPQYTDPVDGEVTYGEWAKSSGSWDKYNAPEIPGYTSNEVPGEVVTPDTEDQTIRIGYSKQQEPETPTIPSQPADKKDSGKVSAVKQQVSTTKISKTNIVNTVQKKVGKQASRNRAQVNKKNDHTLPQTGAHKDMLAIISGALAVGIGLLGLSLDRKKKK